MRGLNLFAYYTKRSATTVPKVRRTPPRMAYRITAASQSGPFILLSPLSSWGSTAILFLDTTRPMNGTPSSRNSHLLT